MQHGWSIGFIAFFSLRILVEPFMRPRETETRSTQRGRISLQLLSLPFLLSGGMVGSYLWRGGPPSLLFFALGFLLFCVGFVGRAVALRELGRGYSFYLDPAPTEGLRTRGPYAYVRHPIYAFYLIETLALPMIRSNWISWLALAVITGVTVWRIQEEEKALLTRYGDEYQAYRDKTHRLLPGIY